MGQILTALHTARVSHQIVQMHTLPPVHSRAGFRLPSRLEDAIVGVFSRPHPEDQVFVHWGAYESGKSLASKVAAARLQQDMGKPVILLQGYHMNTLTTLRKWLRQDIGIPPDRPRDTLSAYIPEGKQALVIFDHADMVLSKYGVSETYGSLKELGVPVLVLVSSWEHALDMKKLGAQLLGTPGFARWTEAELVQLYHSRPESRRFRDCYTDGFLACATLSGCPGILINDLSLYGISEPVSGPNMLRARLIDAEWRNGIRALHGEDMQGVTGAFPTHEGKFNWDEPAPGV
jgi:hypothetical protein